MEHSGPVVFGAQRWELPPLILHPFADQTGPGKLLDSSKASLMLSGVLPRETLTEEDLERKLLEGRLCEVRMLFFVGKDLMRWTAHCAEFAHGIPKLKSAGIRDLSFADLLIEDPPYAVREKLKSWGVLDYKAIFSRALGLNTIFSQPPDNEQLSTEFIRNYYRYADNLYVCRRQVESFSRLSNVNFHFDIYASGEYSKMLEQAWERDA